MKAWQLQKPLSWRFIDQAEPGQPGPGEALVRVLCAGVCGTDFSGYLGKMPFFSYPRIPGHELAVEVTALGEGVTGIRVGDRCSVEPYLNCRACYPCRRGFTNCCENHKTLGVMCDGGFTERLILPARKLHPANGLSAEQCALVETLAIGCHAIDRASALAGETALIVGAGPIGLSALEFAKLAGARPVVMDISESRLEFVRKRMGVRDTILASGEASDLDAFAVLTCGQLADVVVDATGNSKSMVRSLELAAYGGRVVYVGITRENLVFPHAPVMHRRELTIKASRNAQSPDFPRIVSLIGSGDLDTSPWITHRAPFDEVPDAFRQWTDPAAGVIKAIVQMDAK
jgi:alcohol dehydrogenase